MNAALETEFAHLSKGIQAGHLAEILGVSRQMIHRYRTEGAPEERTQALRRYLASRLEEKPSTPGEHPAA